MTPDKAPEKPSREVQESPSAGPAGQTPDSQRAIRDVASSLQEARETPLPASSTGQSITVTGSSLDAAAPQTPGGSGGETESGGAAPAGAPETPGGSVRAFVGAPIAGWDRYEFQELLGQGGMGRVYKAFDRRLKRVVAIKFLRTDDPELSKRFLQEAQAQARVEHEHVCKIYEAGEHQSQLYIAMQCIEGKTLKETSAEMTLEQKLAAIRQVADGLQAAHRTGLVHRDIKPSNIMMARTDDGRWWPYLMDFGLARDVEAGGQTISGAILGTPAYMAPEQAAGQIHLIDRRADVYSLGATTYELLAGRAPFEAESAGALLVKVLSDEPTSLRRVAPHVPLDVETIVMKCLEKDPGRRYDSARSLGDDIGRYLNGEPVLARAAGWSYRFLKRVRRNRALFGVIAASLVLVLTASGFGVRAWWRGKIQANLAHRFGLEIKEMESLLRFSHMSPQHDIRGDLEVVRRGMARVGELMRDAGRAGQAPGDYALGRGYLALGDVEKAKSHLEAAWSGGYREPTVASALGQALGALYVSNLERLGRIQDRKRRESQQKRIEEEYRNPAVEYLTMAGEQHIESPEYVKGLIALYRKDYEAALRRADAARQRAPWLYEALILEGQVYGRKCSEKIDRGDYAGAEQDVARGRAALQEAIQIARSYPAAYRHLARLHLQMMAMNLYETGGDVETEFEKATQTLAQAQATDPEDGSTFAALANAYRMLGEFLLKRTDPGDAVKRFEEAAAAGEKALGLPRCDDRADAATEVAIAHALCGYVDRAVGRDPIPTLTRAIESFRRAAHIDPSSGQAYGGMGIAYLDIGEYQMEKGGEAREALNAAAESFEKAAEMEPASASPYTNLGIIYSDMAQIDWRQGRDPSESFQRGIDVYRKALEINPKHAFAVGNLGSLLVEKAKYSFATGGDPGGVLSEAIDLLLKARQLNPGNPVPLFNLAVAYRVRAQHTISVGGDPREDARASSESARKGMEVAEAPEAALELGATDIVLARWRLQQKQPPLDDLARAESNIRKGLGENPSAVGGLLGLADCRILRARWLISQGKAAGPDLREAERLCRDALSANPRDTDVLGALAECLAWRADEALREGSDPSSAVSEGLDLVEQALTINPRSAGAFMSRGLLYAAKSRAEKTQEARSQAVGQARDAFQDALRLNRNLQRDVQPHLENL